MKYFALLLLLFLSLYSFAQQPFKGGFIAGIAASQIDGDHQSGYKKPGLTLGLYTGRDISSKLSWYLEFKYTGKGAAERFSLFDSIPDQLYEVRLHYLEFPLYLSYKASSSIQLEGGVSFGYLLSSKIYDPNSTEFLDPERSVNKLDYTALLGARFDWTENWAFGLRLNYSIIPTYKPEGSLSNKQAYYNNSLLFSLYYRIQN